MISLQKAKYSSPGSSALPWKLVFIMFTVFTQFKEAKSAPIFLSGAWAFDLFF